MFELERMSGAGEFHIALQTRRRRNIRNSIATDLSELHYRRYAMLLSRFGANWQQRRPPCAEYNCAGHVWASRRTCIYEEDDWRRVLEDDGYRRTSRPVPDDLVLYVDDDSGIIHMGRVVDLRAGVAPNAQKIAWVVSKWQDWTGEVMHLEHDVPFRTQGFDYRIEYWTDRPPHEQA